MNTDPLEWWAANEINFPVLIVMAMQYLGDKEQWNLLWTGEQAFWKAVPHLMAAGHRTAEALTEPRKLDTG